MFAIKPLQRRISKTHPGPLLLLALTLLLTWVAMPANAGDAEPTSDTRPTIGLALGSGGAGGLAHIAILQAFDELGLQPDYIAGTSIGAIIGGLYAAGLSAEEILDIFDDFAGSEMDALSRLARSDLELFELIPLRLGRNALLDADTFLRFLATHTPTRSFDELRIPLTVVATDYWTSQTVTLQEGELFPAIAASMAVPGLFAPVPSDDGRLLIDGGASNPLPYDLLRDKVDIVIAVDVSGAWNVANQPLPGLTDLLFKTFSIMQKSLIREMIRREQPDLYLAPDTGGAQLLHFNRIHLILEAAQPSAAELRQHLKDWRPGDAVTRDQGTRQ
ncbi:MULTISPECIES: patatin-like phospholipase family protein [unclassified Thioalkalivibrio]|uniref:patatin-like phospholipase family protein n=1 Tax=unclassified Thioalkalivibrio TaxID=2621013 RepID=UPI000367DF7A|nr:MULTISPECIES: patatin-like phospholipase family protein [unclassified Thioalkalivibrio]